ncbi:hypothetical protein HER32_00290 [Hymenobacter sp. BT18]|uniref:hypothetical protein n=1 Tax=Hymenobacter sp. BT18 TaxID=2835648 RepID=UPI00143E6F2E|nr:hypothetical protein [Hymenobacter sp. BT18]QIX59714.1 hypothetical protein HER32_00290 [Hymenobacter sp. BT18]
MMQEEVYMTVLIGLVGWLVNRSVSKLDKTVETLTGEVIELKTERKLQDKRMESLEGENRVLRKALRAIDNIIYERFGIKLTYDEF